MVRIAAALLSSAAAQSFTTCNNADAHMKNFQITSSPDPPVLGENVTLSVTGALDKQLAGGNIVISVKAGPINFPLTVPFKRNAVDTTKFVAGEETTITIGPFKYPNIRVPLIRNIAGKVELVDQDSEQVACASFKLPAYSSTVPVSEFTLGDAPFVDCSSATAHVGNKQLDVEPATIKKGVPFTVHGSGDLDEDFASGNFDLNVDLKLFKLGLTIPFSASQPLKAGHADVTVGPITMPRIPLIPNAQGSFKVRDSNAEDVVCYNFNLPVADAVAV